MHIAAALSIAGSDCSAGAGIQADLKTFSHFGIHGLTAISCVVSETAEIVSRVHPVPPEILADQISLLLASFPVAAAKTGMLFSAGHVAAAAEILARFPAVKLVVDPVMIASSGAPLLEPDAIGAYREFLLPRAALITPNLPEAEHLLGRKIPDEAALETAARELADAFGAAVLVKGGHLESAVCTDVLADGKSARFFRAPRIVSAASHGTGCTLSAAITAQLALGLPLPEAVATAKDFLGETLRRSYSFVSSNGSTLHCLNQGIRQPTAP